MVKVVMYTTNVCPYCVRAKDLLKRKNIEFEEIKVDGDDNLRATMMEKAGGKRTVPQIFINDKNIGGSDDLYALEQSGELDKLLK